MRKRYLVTGGAGFVGSHICDALVDGGHEVVILDDFTSGRRANLSAAASGVRVIEADVRDIARHAAAIGKVDAVLHLAALISGHDSLREYDRYAEVNLGGLLRVIEFAAASGVGRIVFASSSTVYGNQRVPVLDETAPTAPLSVYALTKLAGEHLLSIYGKLHGFSHVSLRLFNVYGPRQAVDHPYANVTCKFSHAAANGLGVKRYGDGNQTRDFVYVEDVVHAFLAVLAASRQTVYNVGTGEEHSINALLATLEGLTGRAISVEDLGTWPNDIRRIRADVTRLEREFGVRPRVTLRDGLSRTLDYFAGGEPG